MERVHSMFSNVFSTPAGQLVEKATASSLTNEDWGMNMQVCDTVNSYSDGARDAVKAIKRRLVSNKNFAQINLTLSLLETCVKNCGRNFHVLVTTREFSIDCLMKVIQTKNNPSVILQQKILGLIKQLAQTFGSHPSTSGAKQVYDELRERGFEFPKTEPFETAKAKFNSDGHGGSRNVSQMSRTSVAPHQQGASRSASIQSYHIHPTTEQTTKLRKDLNKVDGNVRVFSEMLTELNPLNCAACDYELLQELNRTCHAMQQRVVELIGQVEDEQITVNLLRINDDLNNVFLRYDRFERFKATQKSIKKSPNTTVASSLNDIEPMATTGLASYHSSLSPMNEPPPSYSDTEQPTPEVNDLIDLSTDPAPTPMLTSNQPAASTSLDTFSLTKEYGDISLNDRSNASNNPASYPMLSEQLDSFDNKPQEIEQFGQSEKAIEQFLSMEGTPMELSEQSNSSTTNNAVTDEFSAFLSERAMVPCTAADSPPISTLQPTTQ